MKLEISCAMCGKEKIISVSTHKFDGNLDVAKVVTDAGWIAQKNERDFDIYCSKKHSE